MCNNKFQHQFILYYSLKVFKLYFLFIWASINKLICKFNKHWLSNNLKWLLTSLLTPFMFSQLCLFYSYFEVRVVNFKSLKVDYFTCIWVAIFCLWFCWIFDLQTCHPKNNCCNIQLHIKFKTVEKMRYTLKINLNS